MPDTDTDRLLNGVAQRRVDALKPGDRVDLQSDIVADPAGYLAAERGDYSGEFSEHPEFEFEFEAVMTITPETADCILIEFESGFTCGFPPDHWVDVDGEQIR